MNKDFCWTWWCLIVSYHVMQHKFQFGSKYCPCANERYISRWPFLTHKTVKLKWTGQFLVFHVPVEIPHTDSTRQKAVMPDLATVDFISTCIFTCMHSHVLMLSSQDTFESEYQLQTNKQNKTKQNKTTISMDYWNSKIFRSHNSSRLDQIVQNSKDCFHKITEFYCTFH